VQGGGGRGSSPISVRFLRFLMNEAKNYMTCTHSFPPHMPNLFFLLFWSLLTAVKNQVTGNFILNAKSEDAETKTFIENGLQWEYSLDGAKEILKATGPLHEGIVVLVSVPGTGSSLFTLDFCPEFLWLC